MANRCPHSLKSATTGYMGFLLYVQVIDYKCAAVGILLTSLGDAG